MNIGKPPDREPWPRRSARFAVDAEVILRRPGKLNYRVRVFDISCHGCKLEFIQPPELDERVWIKFEGLEAMEALVCWIDGLDAGVGFEKPIHPAVFELLLQKLN